MGVEFGKLSPDKIKVPATSAKLFTINKHIPRDGASRFIKEFKIKMPSLARKAKQHKLRPINPMYH